MVFHGQTGINKAAKQPVVDKFLDPLNQMDINVKQCDHMLIVFQDKHYIYQTMQSHLIRCPRSLYQVDIIKESNSRGDFITAILSSIYQQAKQSHADSFPRHHQ